MGSSVHGANGETFNEKAEVWDVCEKLEKERKEAHAARKKVTDEEQISKPLEVQLALLTEQLHNMGVGLPKSEDSSLLSAHLLLSSNELLFFERNGSSAGRSKCRWTPGGKRPLEVRVSERSILKEFAVSGEYDTIYQILIDIASISLAQTFDILIRLNKTFDPSAVVSKQPSEHCSKIKLHEIVGNQQQRLWGGPPTYFFFEQYGLCTMLRTTHQVTQ
ncbi:hypothetical protein AXG93_4142s1250 [Marchantia polymorpha subsp. ruderalis]|uniref:Uncharacterized protein n=1 Tax=Marchantia polymorpha subsp. ruderalis TaxID=1480154 RepID=A0A176WLK3_MARPO|nr:hypothetical protein AXG93_4142s1250 [Marchantia polymorpha subsp. ruderalis]